LTIDGPELADTNGAAVEHFALLCRLDPCTPRLFHPVSIRHTIFEHQPVGPGRYLE